MDMGFPLDLEDMLLDGRIEDANRLICREAAKICGLTAQAVERLRDGDADAMDKKAASRFAELTKEEE